MSVRSMVCWLNTRRCTNWSCRSGGRSFASYGASWDSTVSTPSVTGVTGTAARTDQAMSEPLPPIMSQPGYERREKISGGLAESPQSCDERPGPDPYGEEGPEQAGVFSQEVRAVA